MEKYFLGATSPVGFINHFDNVIDYESGNKLFILKGGSGIGKSTFLKKLVSHFVKKGYEVTEYYCSNAPTSLDGISVRELNIAVIDGTAPHTVDPRCYGVFDSIIDLGKAIKDAPTDLLPRVAILQNIKSNLNLSFQNYLVCAYNYYIDTHQKYNACIDSNVQNLVLENVLQALPEPIKKARNKQVFISALTRDGYVSFLKNVKYDKCICITNGFLSINSSILTKLATILLHSGYSITTFCNNFEPNKCQGILIEDEKLLIYTTSFLDNTILENAQIIDIDQFVNTSLLDRGSVQNNLSLITGVLAHCYSKAQSSSLHHDELEAILHPYVDFTVNEKLLQEFIAEVGK